VFEHQFCPCGFSLSVNREWHTPLTHALHPLRQVMRRGRSFHAAFRYLPSTLRDLAGLIFCRFRQRSWDSVPFAVCPGPWFPAFVSCFTAETFSVVHPHMPLSGALRVRSFLRMSTADSELLPNGSCRYGRLRSDLTGFWVLLPRTSRTEGIRRFQQSILPWALVLLSGFWMSFKTCWRLSSNALTAHRRNRFPRVPIRSWVFDDVQRSANRVSFQWLRGNIPAIIGPSAF